MSDPLALPDALLESPSATEVQHLERQVENILDECFFALGQVVGMRTTIDYEALNFIRDRFRVKFLAQMTTFGNRWEQDRSNVTSVVMMLGERAVRYAQGKPSIDVEAARQASADVERHCALHARRAARMQGLDPSDPEATRMAGYWCTYP
jgi:hypothetical protein